MSTEIRHRRRASIRLALAEFLPQLCLQVYIRLFSSGSDIDDLALFISMVASTATIARVYSRVYVGSRATKQGSGTYFAAMVTGGAVGGDIGIVERMVERIKRGTVQVVSVIR